MRTTKEERNLIIAMAIGDGYIDKRGCITVFHSEKQLEYVKYKFSLVKRLCTHKELIERDSNNTKKYGFRLKVTRFTKLLRKVLYPNGVKVINRKILNRLGPRELAIWWMDNGSCSNIKHPKSGKPVTSISTLSTCLSKEENQVIIDWLLEKFMVKFGQRKMKNSFALVCRMKEGRKLKNVIGSFVIESMKYKLSH